MQSSFLFSLPFSPTLLTFKEKYYMNNWGKGIFFPWIIQEIASIFLFAFHYIYCIGSDHSYLMRLCCYYTVKRAFFSSVLIFQLIMWHLSVSTIHWSDFLRKKMTSHTGLVSSLLISSCLSQVADNFKAMSSISPTGIFYYVMSEFGLSLYKSIRSQLNSGETGHKMM